MNIQPKKLTTPLDDASISALRAGDRVLISGTVFTARDAAHKRLVESLARGESLPFEPRGAVIYYCGPTPARPGRIIGSAGPTTSSRMDAYLAPLLQAGVKGFIGKGSRSPEAAAELRKHRAIYFAAIGGLGALLSLTIKKAELIAYEDLGPEAIYRLELEDFPALVALDVHGGDAYREAVEQYRKSITQSGA